MIGPLTHAFVQSVEVAPDLGRVFYSGPTEIGYVDEQGGKGVTLEPHYAGSLAYEPTEHELYASFELLPEIAIFNARTGRLATRLKLPGWSAFQLVAVPGKVFMLLKDKDGMCTIKRHNPPSSRLGPSKASPRRADLKPTRTTNALFFTRENEVDAIDIARQTVIAKISVSGEPSVSFDTDSGLLVVGWLHSSPQKFDVLQVVRPTGDGLIPVTSLSNEAGGTELVRSHYGFIQHGFHEFLLWSDVGTAPAPSSGTRQRLNDDGRCVAETQRPSSVAYAIFANDAAGPAKNASTRSSSCRGPRSLPFGGRLSPDASLDQGASTTSCIGRPTPKLIFQHATP